VKDDKRERPLRNHSRESRHFVNGARDQHFCCVMCDPVRSITPDDFDINPRVAPAEYAQRRPALVIQFVGPTRWGQTRVWRYSPAVKPGLSSKKASRPEGATRQSLLAYAQGTVFTKQVHQEEQLESLWARQRLYDVSSTAIQDSEESLELMENLLGGGGFGAGGHAGRGLRQFRVHLASLSG